MLVHSYDSIISVENLLFVWQRFLRGKKKKLDVLAFQAELGTNLLGLHDDLKQGTYAHGPYVAFTVADPKPRHIHKATVRDRIVHHLIHQTLYWYFHERFIFDSYSCQNRKGVHKALNRFLFFARKASYNHTRTCYVLKCDIKKFFASIDQATLINILKRDVSDSQTLWLVEQVVGSFDSGQVGVGLPLGNLTSQLLVNVYMHEFDMYVKQELRVKYYIRYADDFVFLSDDRKYLEDLLLQVERFLLEKLSLHLHEHKVYITTVSAGVDFLGWVHFPYHRTLRCVTRKRVIKVLAHMPSRESLNSYRALLQHGNTHKISNL
jgi:retron-type reverse transcriptase